LPPAQAAVLKVAHETHIGLHRVNDVGLWFKHVDVMHLKPGNYVVTCGYWTIKGLKTVYSKVDVRIKFTAEPGHEYLVSAYSPPEWSDRFWIPVVTDLSAKAQYFATGYSGSVVRVRRGKITFVAPTAEDHPHRVVEEGELPVPVTGDFAVGEELSAASMSARVEVVEPLSPAHKYSVAPIENRCQEPVPPEYLELLRWHVEEELYYRNLLAEEGEKPTRVIAVVVTQFRMRTDVSRFMVGIAAGKDKIVSTVTVKDTVSDKALTQTELASSNPSAKGTAETVALTHAKEIHRLVAALPD
jgi:hypothetical protein